jgi:hypothetical protein
MKGAVRASNQTKMTPTAKLRSVQKRRSNKKEWRRHILDQSNQRRDMLVSFSYIVRLCASAAGADAENPMALHLFAALSRSVVAAIVMVDVVCRIIAVDRSCLYVAAAIHTASFQFTRLRAFAVDCRTS